MKRLFETAELEAELFETDLESDESADSQEIDLDDLSAESMMALENLTDEEMDDFPALELTLELTDGRILEYEVAASFVHKDKEYLGLHPKSDTDGLIHIMQMTQGENDELVLHQMKDEEEIQEVYQVFFNLFAEPDNYEELSSDEEFEEDFEEENDPEEAFPEDGSERNENNNESE